MSGWHYWIRSKLHLLGHPVISHRLSWRYKKRQEIKFSDILWRIYICVWFVGGFWGGGLNIICRLILNYQAVRTGPLWLAQRNSFKPPWFCDAWTHNCSEYGFQIIEKNCSILPLNACNERLYFCAYLQCTTHVLIPSFIELCQILFCKDGRYMFSIHLKNQKQIITIVGIVILLWPHFPHNINENQFYDMFPRM